MPAKDKGRSKNRTKDDPNKSKHGRRNQDHRDHPRDRGFHVHALPGDDHIAGTIGEPGRAEGERTDHKQKKDDADHCDTGLPRAASASAAMRRLAASAASRASTFLIQLCVGDRTRSGNEAIPASALAKSPRATSLLMRATTADASSPGGASTGVMRTKFFA